MSNLATLDVLTPSHLVDGEENKAAAEYRSLVISIPGCLTSGAMCSASVAGFQCDSAHVEKLWEVTIPIWRNVGTVSGEC